MQLSSVYNSLINRNRIPFLLVLIALGILLLFVVLNRSDEPVALQRSAIRVQVIRVHPTSEKIQISGFGTVEPSKLLDVYSQVAGHVTALHPQFEEGGRIPEGDTLFQIDTSDYEIAVEAGKAAVARAENELRLEGGNQEVAKYEYELFKKDMPEGERINDLALRKPQLRNKEISLKEAKNQLKKALLDLERSTIRAPFSSLVLKRNVTMGTIVNTGTVVAQLASSDKFFIKVRIPAESLDWISFDPETGLLSENNEVNIVHLRKDGAECVRQGTAERIISSVDGSGRMVQLLVSLNDPLKPTDSCVPFLIGTYVKVNVSGKELEGVLRIPRRAVREQNKIFVADAEARLRIRTPQIVYETEDSIWIKDTFPPSDRVIVSDVQIPLDGMKLELEVVENQ